MSELSMGNEKSDLSARLARAFQRRLSLPARTEPKLAAALHETLGRPGNLVRAQLAFQVAIVYGLPDAKAEQLAVALEYFHTASLLFDDLPSMDDAVHRRGALCVHRVYGEGTAVLAALTLINRAYALVWSAMQELPAPQRQRAAHCLEQYLGLNGVLNGQSRDIHFSEADRLSKRAQQIALEKTASLIRLPLVLPALMGGGSARECHQLDRLAKFWGLAYQASDDLKDVLREEQQTGKTAGRDEALQRPNAALELGTEATIERVHRLAQLAETTVRQLKQHRPALRFLDEVGARLKADTREILLHTEAAACSL